MIRVVLLDAWPLSLACNPRGKSPAPECQAWVEALMAGGDTVVIPEITDYEVRRELVRLRKTSSLRYLDKLAQICQYAPLTTATMRRAAHLWAQARQQGYQTADDKALDADVILAAQAQLLVRPDVEVIVATSNPGHLGRFVQASIWQDIVPVQL